MADDDPAGVLEGDDVVGEQRGSAPEELGGEGRLAPALVGDEGEQAVGGGDRAGVQQLKAQVQAGRPQHRVEEHSLADGIRGPGERAAQPAAIGVKVKQSAPSKVKEKVSGGPLQRGKGTLLVRHQMSEESRLLGQREQWPRLGAG